MAVTAHWVANENGHMVLRSALVAFRHLRGNHTGAHIAAELYKIIDSIGCLDKISMITLDNASNNNTCMDAVAAELTKQGIPFDAERVCLGCCRCRCARRVRSVDHVQISGWTRPNRVPI